MKRIAILGSTGSIGTQALDIIDRHADKYKVTVLSCARRVSALEAQIKKYRPELVAVNDEKDALYLSAKYPHTEIVWGQEGLITAAESDYDLLLNSLMGMRGLSPTYHAVKKRRKIAFANKETLVAGGKLITDTIKSFSRPGEKAEPILLPVDSEHSAIFQCLHGEEDRPVKRILLTASGGPFRGYSKEQLESVTLEQALRHPNWSMGAKITIDSATMMNKGLEVIEARWLFDIDVDKIEILVHPQSVIHSMVEFEDTSVIAQLGMPDMRVPISYAFSYPEREDNRDLPSLDFFNRANTLTFERPDMETFGCIKLAYDALREGGSATVAMNAANEVLVQLFLDNKIRFTDIQKYIEKILEGHKTVYDLDLEGILSVDKEVRGKTERLVRGGL